MGSLAKQEQVRDQLKLRKLPYWANPGVVTLKEKVVKNNEWQLWYCNNSKHNMEYWQTKDRITPICPAMDWEAKERAMHESPIKQGCCACQFATGFFAHGKNTNHENSAQPQNTKPPTKMKSTYSDVPT